MEVGHELLKFCSIGINARLEPAALLPSAREGARILRTYLSSSDDSLIDMEDLLRNLENFAKMS